MRISWRLFLDICTHCTKNGEIVQLEISARKACQSGGFLLRAMFDASTEEVYQNNFLYVVILYLL